MESSFPIGMSPVVAPIHATNTQNLKNASQLSFRRQRASRACETCHARKVRCDAASLGVPCTNCTAFGIECKIPTPKRKKDKDSNQDESVHEANESPIPASLSPIPNELSHHERKVSAGPPPTSASIFGRSPQSDGMPSSAESDTFANRMAAGDGHFMKPKFARAPIKEAGRVAYLGESSNLSLLVHDRYGNSDVVHYPLPESVRGAKAKRDDLDNMEIDLLHQRGAFLLPPRALCDELVEAYFTWVAPIVPVINRNRFMRQYRDPKNPPSLLLLQAMLLAGSRVCSNPQLMDASGSATPAAMTFYKRAKALYDANYEDDRVTIVQAAILLGWYWEGPEDVTKNVFYWTRNAIIIAQGSGMHRSVERSQLSRSDKRLWKRIWWTLFSRDRSVAVALGRPVGINPDDSDVEMVSEEDFIEDDQDRPLEYHPNPTHIQFFLNYVRLCEIMGLVLSQQYSVASKYRRTNAIDLTHSDMALADWLQHCPKEVYWERNRHHFWAAMLHLNYYTTLCLLHRAYMPPAGSPKANGAEEGAYPSRNIAYSAAGQITAIVESLQANEELRHAPAFIVYSLFSALIMHVYQMRSNNKTVVSVSEQRLKTCMDVLKAVSRTWMVGKMVHTLFESIIGNKHLEERLQKAAGNRHKKQPSTASAKQEALKRKYDEMDLGLPNGPPAPPVSYERSQPQTPAMTPSRELPQQQQQQQQQTMPQMNTSPQLSRQPNEPFMGAGVPSRSSTRPTTPFNPGYSYPNTPPELFLVTRNSPNLSQDIWQNFQPDQLFPAETNVQIPQIPMQQNAPMVDPQLQRQSSIIHNLQMNGHIGGTNGMPQQMGAGGGIGFDPGATMGAQGWAGMAGQRGEDAWSNSSRGAGVSVPTNLNMEDWLHFFGINGETALDTF